MEVQNRSLRKRVEKSKSKGAALEPRGIRSICHELRRPLSVVQAYAELLQDEITGKLSEEQKGDIATILRNTHWLERMIQNLSDLAKIEEKTFYTEKNAVSLVPIFKQSTEDLAHLFWRKDISIEYEANCDQKTCGEPGRLRQVFDNLLESMAEFTLASGKVWQRVSQQEDFIRVEIWNNSPAPSKSVLEGIFDSNYKTEQSGAFLTGNGIGLAVSRKIVEAYGGRIRADLGKNDGMHFFLELPIAPSGEFSPKEPLVQKN